MSNPAVIAGIYVLLVIGSSVNFRQRDPLATLNNTIDAQVAFELAVWCGLAAWIGLRTVREGQGSPLNHPLSLGPVLLSYLPFLAITAMSTVYTTVPLLSRVRGFQMLVLFAFTAWAYATLSSVPDAFERFWLAYRRAWWALGLIATALTFAVPLWTPFVTNFQGANRFRWFAGQPVGTASLLGICIVLLAGGVLGYTDPLFRGRFAVLVRNGMFVLFGTALLATKARGALGATVVAVTVLALLSPDRRQRGWAALGCLAAMLFLFSGPLVDLATDIVLRQQDTAQILTLTGRTSLAAEAMPLILERPFFGHGFLSARSAFLDLVWGAGEAHNMLLEVLFSTGLVGLAIFLAFVGRFMLLQRTSLHAASGRTAGLARESIALLAFLLTVGVVQAGFVGAPGAHTITLMMAILCADIGLGPLARRAQLGKSSRVPGGDATFVRPAASTRGAPGRP